ncbi:hypothetical protein [Falsibacillus albus]|uniref:Uncharacterized protein n=1 Tax=Falsibacillus albus TaxID=2478915 RepID=A0A3L7JJX0_9BACI|nr:hypothetical protein [Falsibacillus albus]RLQ90605.1 hypothetical protein D9X91_21740 [Falsibacillus albus]
MSLYMILLTIIGVVIVGGALIYTLMIGKGQKAVDGEFDASVSDPVKRHSYLRNPIFLTYIIVISLALLYVLYEVIQHRY